MSDITAETIKKILDISQPEIHDIQDVHGVPARYSTKPLYQVKAEPSALPETLHVNTLAGFADLIHAKLEDHDFPGDDVFMIHIEDEDTVTLKDKSSDWYGRRQVLAKATPVPFEQFVFGRWMTQEEFTIAVASRFADTPDKAYVLGLAASLTNEATRTSEDDGFTQKVNVQAGLTLKSTVTIKPRVALAPFRTFPELEQPVSDFVFRARCEGRGPELMLVEADGGRWKVDAIAKIRAAIDAMQLGIPIIA